MIRKIIGWPAAWALYWLGDLVSRPLQFDSVDDWPEWVCDVFYRPYNWFMCNSMHVQVWAELDGPWLLSEKQEIQETEA